MRINWKVLGLFFGCLVGFVLVMLALDRWLALTWGSKATFSYQLATMGFEYPLFTAVAWFLFGFGIGGLLVHLYNPMVDPKTQAKIDAMEKRIADLVNLLAAQNYRNANDPMIGPRGFVELEELRKRVAEQDELLMAYESIGLPLLDDENLNL